MGKPFLEQLDEDLAAVAFVANADTSDEFQELLDRARRLLEVKLRFEEKRSGGPPLVVIAGGTNVGKSTVFNWIVGDSVASSSPLARHTKAPTVYVHSEELAALRNGVFLPSYRRLKLETSADPAREAEGGSTAYFLLTHDRDDVRSVVLVDSPDIDSTHARNRAVAEDLLYLADAVIFVATPEKYNDELCVSYLRDAVDLGKSLTCVLNKGADAAVARDFKEVVVPKLGSEIRVITLPYVVPKPDPATSEAYRAELHSAVIAPSEGGASLREAAIRGARIRLGRDLENLGGRLREELSELDRVRSEVEMVVKARRDEYEKFLNSIDFYELDRVFEQVLKYFKIPVIDHVYDGFRNAIGFVSSNVARVVTGKAPSDSRKAKLVERSENDRQKVKEIIGSARGEALELPYRHTGTLRAAVPSWVEGLESPSIEELNTQVEAFQAKADAESERWIELETRRQVEILEKHPYARNALRTVKGVFQVGFGLLSAKLTMGFGPWDLLIGSAAERATKTILEAAGGKIYYQNLRAEFSRTRADLFGELLRTSVSAPLIARLPTGVEPERLERIGESASMLRRGEAPAPPASEQEPEPKPEPAEAKA